MRLDKLLFSFLAAAILFSSCGKDEEPEPIIPVNADYTGTVSVVYQESPFDTPDISVNFTPSADGKTASITIYKIKFVPQMPVTIDVTIPNINVSATGNVLNLSKDQVVPLAMVVNIPATPSRNSREQLREKESPSPSNSGITRHLSLAQKSSRESHRSPRGTFSRGLLASSRSPSSYRRRNGEP